MKNKLSFSREISLIISNCWCKKIEIRKATVGDYYHKIWPLKFRDLVENSFTTEQAQWSLIVICHCRVANGFTAGQTAVRFHRS